MFVSVFTDELGLDIGEALPIIHSWGVRAVDLRSKIYGKPIEKLDDGELRRLKALLESLGMTVGCLQTSLCKAHMPDAEEQATHAEKLEGIIRAADALECRLVRSFHYWQTYRSETDQDGDLAEGREVLDQLLEMMAPIVTRAKDAGLVLAFENCDVIPADVFAVLDALGVPGWGMAWDVANTWYKDNKPDGEDAFIKRMATRAKCVHVKAWGSLSRLKPDLIPYGEILRVCQHLGMNGPISAETHNFKKHGTDQEVTREVVEAIRSAWPPNTAESAVLS